MSECNIPVDVICVCSAGGEIRPLRLRLEQEDHSLQRIDVDEIVSTRQIKHTGAEAQVYRCKAVIENQVWIFDLKYFIRSHKWCLFRKVC